MASAWSWLEGEGFRIDTIASRGTGTENEIDQSIRIYTRTDIAREEDLVFSVSVDFWCHANTAKVPINRAYKTLRLSIIHRSSEVLKLDLLQRTNKLIGGVWSGHNWDGLRIPKCFLQVFRSTGYVCNLGTSSVKSDEFG